MVMLNKLKLMEIGKMKNKWWGPKKGGSDKLKSHWDKIEAKRLLRKKQLMAALDKDDREYGKTEIYFDKPKMTKYEDLI